MNTINVKRLGLAFGSTGALLYAGCMILMLTLGHDGTVTFFDSILHGFNTAPILRMEVPLWQACLGVIETFILGWLTGAMIAAVYNLGSKTK